MSEKKQILESLAALAKKLGRTPSLLEFVARAGISKHSVMRHFGKWNDAVRAAGLPPTTLIVRLDTNELLRDWGETVRKCRVIPTRRIYRRKGKYDPRTIERQCGPWSSLPQVFRDFAKSKPEWGDVLALLSAITARKESTRKKPAHAGSTNQIRHIELPDRPIYGNPIDFRGLRHEPVNEQGVVFLFGMLAKELGYSVEAVQKGFPDCEAKREVVPGRWQRVRIEFEYESKNFYDHGHPSTGCDVIVCWRHNWKECPANIEVVELCSVVKSLPTRTT